MDVTGAIKGSFNFLKEKPLVFVPGVLAAIIVVFTLYLHSLLPVGDVFNVTYWAYYVGILFVSVVLSTIAVLWTISFVYNKGKNVFDFSLVVKSLPAAIAANIITTVIVLVGFVALIIPGIYLVIKLAFVEPAVILDKKGPVNALKHSWNLTKGHWWDTSTLFLLLGLLSMIVVIPFMALSTNTLLSGELMTAALAQDTAAYQSLMTSYYQSMMPYVALMVFLITPFIYTAFTLYYLQLRPAKAKKKK